MTNQEDISHYMGLAKDTLLATCAKVRKNLQDLFPEIMILLLVLRKRILRRWRSTVNTTSTHTEVPSGKASTGVSIIQSSSGNF